MYDVPQNIDLAVQRPPFFLILGPILDLADGPK